MAIKPTKADLQARRKEMHSLLARMIEQSELYRLTGADEYTLRFEETDVNEDNPTGRVTLITHYGDKKLGPSKTKELIGELRAEGIPSGHIFYKDGLTAFRYFDETTARIKSYTSLREYQEDVNKIVPLMPLETLVSKRQHEDDLFAYFVPGRPHRSLPRVELFSMKKRWLNYGYRPPQDEQLADRWAITYKQPELQAILFKPDHALIFDVRSTLATLRQAPWITAETGRQYAIPARGPAQLDFGLAGATHVQQEELRYRKKR